MNNKIVVLDRYEAGHFTEDPDHITTEVALDMCQYYGARAVRVCEVTYYPYDNKLPGFVYKSDKDVNDFERHLPNFTD